jgi:hypothetical protein
VKSAKTNFRVAVGRNKARRTACSCAADFIGPVHVRSLFFRRGVGLVTRSDLAQSSSGLAVTPTDMSQVREMSRLIAPFSDAELHNHLLSVLLMIGRPDVGTSMLVIGVKQVHRRLTSMLFIDQCRPRACRMCVRCLRPAPLHFLDAELHNHASLSWCGSKYQ